MISSLTKLSMLLALNTVLIFGGLQAAAANNRKNPQAIRVVHGVGDFEYIF